MYCIHIIICLAFCTLFVLTVCANKSISYHKDSASPAIKARVFQEASNLLPPEGETAPQPAVPAEPEPPSTSSQILDTIWNLLPGGSGLGGLGSVGGLGGMSGLVSQPPKATENGWFTKWMLGDKPSVEVGTGIKEVKDKSDKKDTKIEKKDKSSKPLGDL